jgi:hypothetical protein
MEFLWDFVINPTPQNYAALVKSTKLKNLIGPSIDNLINAIKCTYHNQSGWECIIFASSAEEKASREMFACDTIDVISKLVALPRLGLLQKAWCLFWGTGQLKFLQAAFAVAGNVRASYSLQLEAINMFTQNKECLCEANTSPCIRAWNEFEQELFNNQLLLRDSGCNIPEQTSEVSYNDDKFNATQNKKCESIEKNESDLEKASELFDTIANDLFKKIK